MEQLLNLPNEEFIEKMKKEGTGFKLSVSNLMKARYSQLTLVKNSLVELISTKKKLGIPSKDIELAEKSYKECYEYMLVMESKYNILQELID